LLLFTAQVMKVVTLFLSGSKPNSLALIRLHQSYKLEDPQSTFVKQPRAIIASMAGVAKESATRTMIDFVEEGIVEVTPEGYRILKFDRLERLAG
jgi:hypothetical protein